MQTDPVIFFNFSPCFFSFLNTSSENGSVFGEEVENSNMQILRRSVAVYYCSPETMIFLNKFLCLLLNDSFSSNVEIVHHMVPK